MANKKTHEPDFVRMRALIKEAQGKSLRDYAKRAKVNPGLLARINQGTYIPGPVILARLARAAAIQREGVLQEFMAAAGYSESSIDFEGLKEAMSYISAAATIAEQHQMFQMKAMDIILPAMQSNNILAEPEDWNKYYYIAFQPEECFVVQGLEIERLWFVFWSADSDDDYGGYSSPEDKAAALIRQPLPIDADEKRKIVLVTNSRPVHDALCGYAWHTSYRGWLSAVLIDPEREVVTNETLLASYDANSKTDPLPII